MRDCETNGGRTNRDCDIHLPGPAYHLLHQSLDLWQLWLRRNLGNARNGSIHEPGILGPETRRVDGETLNLCMN